MCYASSPSIRTCPPSLGPTIPTPPLMTASASKSSCSVNSPPTSSRGTRPVKRMPCLNSRMAGQTACSSGAAGRHRSGRSVSSTRLGRSLTGFGCLMISNLPRGATLAHSGYRGLYGRGNAPGPFLLCPCSRATWALFFSPPRPLRGSRGRCLPPDPRQTHIAEVMGPGYGKQLVVPTPLHAPRLPTLLQALHVVVGTAAPATAPPLTNAAPATANALTSTRPITRHSVFLAGVWGEASPPGSHLHQANPAKEGSRRS